jgi:hypothetical protein
MAIDYSLFAIPKGRPKALDKADKQRQIEAEDKRTSAVAKVRAQGRCEVYVRVDDRSRKAVYVRCERRDTQTHHLIGGIGRRNRGDSIKAHKKLRTCDECHKAITANVLKPTTADHDAHTVRYWRAR